MKFLIQGQLVGIFSNINRVVSWASIKPDDELFVDWTPKRFCLYGTGGENSYERLFTQSAIPADAAILDDWPFMTYTYKNIAPLYGKTEWRMLLNAAWQRMGVKQYLVHEAAQMTPLLFQRGSTAIHVRSPTMAREQPNDRNPSYAEYMAALDGTSGPVFLATDTQAAVDFFTKALGPRLLIRDVARGVNGEIHAGGGRPLSEAKDCIIDALIMSKCDRLVHAVSNIATAALYMNPSLDHTFLVG